MLRIAVAVVCLTALCTYGSAAPRREKGDDEVNVTGTWNVEVDLGGNSGTPVFTFKQKGNALTGKYKGQLGEADLKGKVAENKIEFSFSVGVMGKAEYTGTVDGDTMKGKVKYGDQLSGTFTGKKAKEKAK